MGQIKKGALSIHHGRKADHIAISLNEDVAFHETTTGFERWRLIHQALPEIDYDNLDISTVFLKHNLSLPLMISSMVGGVDEAVRINRNLAIAAGELNCAMGVGSQRCALDAPHLAETFSVRKWAPDIFLAANIGAVQLNYGYTADHCRRAVDMIKADALIFHLNPLQEAIQPGGNRNFFRLTEKIEEVCRKIEIPVIVKEVGSGISSRAARLLLDAGVSAIDCAGAGGTSWSEVERKRARTPEDERVASYFSEWGIPTSISLQNVRSQSKTTTLIASGGIKNGVDGAKAFSLGADLVGIAMPLLASAVESEAAVIRELEIFRDTLRMAMFCSGSRTIKELQTTSNLMTDGGILWEKQL